MQVTVNKLIKTNSLSFNKHTWSLSLAVLDIDSTLRYNPATVDCLIDIDD